MIIRSATFAGSSTSLIHCPSGSLPEFGFIGRSNVGKSSLINMLTGRKKLAKTSGDPGKTRAINHFLINEQWYLVDLPGYGYAKVPARLREQWTRIAREYILKRETLVCLFMLLDSRHKPQKADIEFMEFLGRNRIPFARVFTKIDKLNRSALKRSIQEYNTVLLQKWETLPVTFNTSTASKAGKIEILNFIEETFNNLSKQD